MRILVDYRPALRHRTGVGEYVHHLAQALARRTDADVALTLFSSSWKDRLGETAVPGAARLDARIPVRVLNFAWHRLEWPPIERLGAAPDVVWTLHPLLMPSRRAARLVTVHDLYFLDHPEHVTAEIRRDYPALAAAHTARADGVIAISEYTRDTAVARLGLPASKITVVHPGRPPWSPRREPERPGPILHVGTIEPRKNVGAVVAAYRRLLASMPGAPPLVFAGRVAKPELAAVPGDLSERVRFLGYIKDEEKLQLYRDASMLVVPSADEGFGIPALEAMTLGVPVVAANRGSLPEVVGDAGLLVDGDSPEALATAMGRILGDRPMRLDLSTRAVVRARRFDWNESAARLLDAFRAALARRRTSA